jgi:16S rRNA (guanine527-N7)-methyltransferase
MRLSEDAESVLRRFNVSRESTARLERYVELLHHWQTRINLVGPSTLAHIWTRHIADSLQLLALMPPPPLAIADLGSGAGIPGLILTLAAPYEVHLYESNGKKAAFLREAIRVTGANAHVHQMRIEDVAIAKDRPKVGIVVARALAPLDRLIELAHPFLADGATGMFLKGQDVEAELTRATKSWRITVTKHLSLTDSHGVILVITEAHHV